MALRIRELDRLHEKGRQDRQLAALRRRSRVDLPLVVHLHEAVQRVVLGERQLDFRTEREDLVLAADEDVGKALDLVVGQLERRVVVEAGASARP